MRVGHYFLGKFYPRQFGDSIIDELEEDGAEHLTASEGCLLTYSAAIFSLRGKIIVLTERALNCWASCYYMHVYNEIEEIPSEVWERATELEEA